jgi:hypothetical protein
MMSANVYNILDDVVERAKTIDWNINLRDYEEETLEAYNLSLEDLNKDLEEKMKYSKETEFLSICISEKANENKALAILASLNYDEDHKIFFIGDMNTDKGTYEFQWSLV